MAAAPLASVVVSAAVVRLPTAAPRKVVNGRWAEQREAARALKNQSADRFTLRHPYEREKMREVECMADYLETHPLTEERLAIYAIVKALGEDIALKALANSNRDRGASNLIRLAIANGEQRYWLNQLLSDRGLA